MKKIVLTSLSALMLSVAAAGAAETSSNTRIFFGINAGIRGYNYDTTFKTVTDNMGMITGAFNLKFPKTDTVVGLEAGMRFGGYESIWNGGFTVSADRTLGKRPEIQTVDPDFWTSGDPMMMMAIEKIKASTNIFDATFDNYIRLNKSVENRVDLVVGVGAASIETNINLFSVGLPLDCHAAVLKAGLEIQLTDVISMTLGSRMYVPVASQYFDTSYALKGGFKFSF